eukprot:2589121-Amphidinium_carterae.1
MLRHDDFHGEILLAWLGLCLGDSFLPQQQHNKELPSIVVGAGVVRTPPPKPNPALQICTSMST